MTDFAFTPAKKPDEEAWLAFNYKKVLPEGVDLFTDPAPVCWVSVKTGVDASPNAMLSGNPVVDVAGKRVLQLYIGGVPDVEYELHCLAATSDGQKLHECGTLWVQNC